jgi:hypothetical protein
VALINCPECNKEISDKVKACPYCGHPVSDDIDKHNQVQQVEVTGVKLKKGINKNVIVTIPLIIVIAIIAFLGIRYINEQKAQRLYEESFNTYIDNLNKFQSLIFNEYLYIEGFTGWTLQVWSDAIWEYPDDAVHEYIRPKGYFVDWKEALTNLYSDASTKLVIQGIEDKQTAIQALMKELQNPPKGLETCYATATEMYTAYQGYVNLAINPSGNYVSYRDSVGSKDSDFWEANKKLQSQIPDKIGTESDN